MIPEMADEARLPLYMTLKIDQPRMGNLFDLIKTPLLWRAVTSLYEVKTTPEFLNKTTCTRCLNKFSKIKKKYYYKKTIRKKKKKYQLKQNEMGKIKINTKSH